MAYTLALGIALGSSATGLTLAAQLVDTAGSNVGGSVTTGFVEIGLGNYMWTGSIPDAHRGGVKVSISGGALQAFCAINAQEVENSDVKTSSRSSHSAADVVTAMDASSADIDSIISSLSTLSLRLTATRAGYLDNLATAPPTASAIRAEIDSSSADLDAIQTTLATFAATLSAITGYVDEIESRLTSVRAAKLDNLDVTVGSRLATAGYTAPDNTDVVAIKVVTDKVAGMIEASGGHDRYKANALEQAPTGSGGGTSTTGAIVRELLVSPPGLFVSDGITLVRGDDYTGVSKLVWRMASDELWPDLTGASLTFTARINGGATITVAGVVETATGAAKEVSAEISHTSLAAAGVGTWDIQATLSSGAIKTLRKGSITITNDVT